jgi:nucleoside recognition membrane protein YjiH
MFSSIFSYDEYSWYVLFVVGTIGNLIAFHGTLSLRGAEPMERTTSMVLGLILLFLPSFITLPLSHGAELDSVTDFILKGR